MQDATKRWLDEDEQRVYDDPTNVHPGGNESRLMDIIDRLCAELDKQQEVIDTALEFSNEGDNKAARYVLGGAAASARTEAKP